MQSTLQLKMEMEREETCAENGWKASLLRRRDACMRYMHAILCVLVFVN